MQRPATPGSQKKNIAPTSGRCSSSACSRSRFHIRLKSWVVPSTSSPCSLSSPAKRTRPCGGSTWATRPSSKCRRTPLPCSSTSSRSTPGRRRTRRPVRFRPPTGAAPSHPLRGQAQDLAGPAKSIPPAFAAIVRAGNDRLGVCSRSRCSSTHCIMPRAVVHHRVASVPRPPHPPASSCECFNQSGRGSKQTPSCHHATHRSAAWPPTAAPPGNQAASQPPLQLRGGRVHIRRTMDDDRAIARTVIEARFQAGQRSE